MIEPLDFPKLESVCWRALCRHQVSELEMVMAVTVLRLSFGVGEPYLRLEHAVELSKLTGMSKGKAHEVVRRLVRSRVLEVSMDRCVYTFLPPSRSWPWLFAERFANAGETARADELERGIIWANKGGQRQGDFFGPEPGQEFAEALALERMRGSLLEFHQEAAARFAGGLDFPVTDRSPKSAPAPGLSGSEGLTRPLGTGEVAGDLSSSPETFRTGLETASENAPSRHDLSELETECGAASQTGPIDERFPKREPDGSRKGNRVPESGTSPLKGFKGLKSSEELLNFESFKGRFPNREPFEPLGPDATENEIVAWMRPALGKLCGPCFEAHQKCKCKEPTLVPVMDKLGGWWRLRIRESRWAAINACMDLFLRLTTPGAKPLKNRGGWTRDQYFKIRGEPAAKNLDPERHTS